MADFLTKTFYGNTISQWAIALGIIVGVFVVGKILYWFFGGVVRKLTSKTKTRLDDIILDMIEEPLVFVVTVAGIRYALSTLTLSETASKWTGNVVQVLIVLAVTWLVASGSARFNCSMAGFMAPLRAKYSALDWCRPSMLPALPWTSASRYQICASLAWSRTCRDSNWSALA